MQAYRLRIAAEFLKLLLLLMAVVSGGFAIYIRFYSGWIPALDQPHVPVYAGYFLASFAVWSVLGMRARLLQSLLTDPSVWAWLWTLLRLDSLALALVSAGTFFWRGYSFSRYTVVLFWALYLPLSLAAAWVVRWWVHRDAGESRLWAVVIGDADLEALRTAYVPAGERVIAMRAPGVAAAVSLLTYSELPVGAREVVVLLPAKECSGLRELAKALEQLPLPGSITVEGLPFEDVYALPSLVMFATGPKAAGDFDYVFAKRLLDLVVSSAGLLVLSPLMLVLAAVIRIRSGGPVLIAQERVGSGGKHFLLYKFRSLPASSLAESDTQWSVPAADRWGRFLRRTGLDELPQLMNVLRGEMSLVGPRPERPLFVKQFQEQLPFYSTRHRLRSGITGWAQVNGWRGDTSIKRRVEHDLYYLRHWSFGFDLRILWMTVVNLTRQLRESGADAEGVPHARSV